MRKYILFGLAALLAVAMIGLGTFAWFSDTETVTGTFRSGIIDLVVNEPEDAVFEIGDMKPCDTHYQEVQIDLAEGSNEGPVWLHIDGMTGNTGLADWITFDLGLGTIDEGTGEPVYEPDGTIIHPDDHMKLSDLRSVSIDLGRLDGPKDLVLSFHLQGETPNSMQGKTMDVKFEFILTDHNAPPPTSGIILENKDTSTWEPILGDGIWGICRYDVGSLNLDVMAKGLDSETKYQVGISSPNAGDTRLTADEQKAIASALASNVYSSDSPSTAPPTGWNIYERAYYTPGATATHSGEYVDGDEGIYSFSKDGLHAWDVDGADLAAGVSVSCDLPAGVYKYIKVLIKMDVSPWTGELMEKTTTLFFEI